MVGCLLRSGEPEKGPSITTAGVTVSPSLVAAWWPGVQKTSATGKVYNLNNLSSFSGTYHGISTGLTLIEGKMHAKLTNQNGVVMYLAGQTKAWPPPSGRRHFRST